jgi:hypothetical protein
VLFRRDAFLQEIEDTAAYTMQQDHIAELEEGSVQFSIESIICLVVAFLWFAFSIIHLFGVRRYTEGKMCGGCCKTSTELAPIEDEANKSVSTDRDSLEENKHMAELASYLKKICKIQIAFTIVMFSILAKNN